MAKKRDLTPEKQAAGLESTKQFAAAFVEDMVYIRELLASPGRSAADLRRLSTVIRRLLVYDDLQKISPFRTGSVRISAPDNDPIYSTARRRPTQFFVSGGMPLFGIQWRACTVPEVILSDRDRQRTVELKVDAFLKQRVLALYDEWADRGDVIKYVANTTSGAHSDHPETGTERLLVRLQRFVRLSHEDGVTRFQVDLEAGYPGRELPPFAWSPTTIDVVLFELMAAAHFLAISPDILALEAAVRSELQA